MASAHCEFFHCSVETAFVMAVDWQEQKNLHLFCGAIDSSWSDFLIWIERDGSTVTIHESAVRIGRPIAMAALAKDS